MTESANAIISEMPLPDAFTLREMVKEGKCNRSVPNIFRAVSGEWQCQWDDMPEIGRFDSRWLWLAVRKAQRARSKQVLRYIADRIGGAS